MKYIINSNIDFYKEINSIDDNEFVNLKSNICNLTCEELTDNYVTLACNHKFNYIPLYNELCKQKNNKNNYLETTNLSVNQIKCPYCREITNKVLPYIINENVQLKNGVNYPSKHSLCINNCSWIFKSGKNKGFPCNCSSFIYNSNNFCLKHHNIFNKMNVKEENNYDKEFIEKIKKKYTINLLKLKLKENKLKVTGKKEELIIRLLNNNINIEII